MNKFNYLQPKSLEEASKFLKVKTQTSLPFAGGTDVLGLIKNSIISPQNVVNLKQLKNLNTINYVQGKELHIGALTTLAEISEHTVIKEKFTVLSQAAHEVASPQFRNIATIGGNICQRPRCMFYRKDNINCLRKGGDICFAFNGHNKYHCITGGGPCYMVHPSDTAVALLALNAMVSIYSGGKSKIIPIKDFFVLPEIDYTKENILKQGEILEKIIIPLLPEGSKSGYVKFKEREVWDFAIVSVAAVITKKQSVLDTVKLAFGGIAPVPWNDRAIDDLFKGTQAAEGALAAAADKMFPKADILEMNGYKIPLVRNLTKRLLLSL